MIIRKFSELNRLETFEDRYEYLRLRGAVGEATFGFDRYINQGFYRSSEWKQTRHRVIARDNGCDMGLAGNEIFDKIVIHHMNPMTAQAIEDGDVDILNPEYLITVTHNTHNAIHYGDSSLLNQPLKERAPGDTKLW